MKLIFVLLFLVFVVILNTVGIKVIDAVIGTSFLMFALLAMYDIALERRETSLKRDTDHLNKF